MFADNILQRIISTKKKGDLIIYRTQKIGSKEKQFCVKRDSVFSHGKTLKEAIEDLQYKISDRDITEFKTWTKSTKVTKSKMIEAYRKITGACVLGVKDFVENNKIKNKITVEEVINVTTGKYGHSEFVRFFNR